MGENVIDDWWEKSGRRTGLGGMVCIHFFAETPIPKFTSRQGHIQPACQNGATARPSVAHHWGHPPNRQGLPCHHHNLILILRHRKSPTTTVDVLETSEA